MKKKRRVLKLYNRNGSITIIAIYIFLLILTSSTLILFFASSQAALSRNQLEKVQDRYAIEDILNKLVYDDLMIDKYIKEKIFRIYRTGFKANDNKHDLIIDKDDSLGETINKSIFILENIDERENIIIEISSKNKNNIDRKIIASGPCIRRVFELKESVLIEDTLDSFEKELFLEFIDQIEDENCDYDCKLNINSKKVNLEDHTIIKFEKKTYDTDSLFYKKKILESKEDGQKEVMEFTRESIILNIKSEDRDKSLTIGRVEESELIKLNGVLYIEGDLIIEQDLEFSGLIIVNGGNIVINSLNKAKINGMIFFRGDSIELEKIDLTYDQKAIYKQASFLPGFLEIEIDTIKKY